jgi:2-hydroxy-6-oxonona-2,4-dienedioate hydrolase
MEALNTQLQRRAAKPVNIPHGFVSTFTQVLGHEVHALATRGVTGPPGEADGHCEKSTQIVMIHGALASRRYLLPTAELLAKHVQVFVPEMPGHGASSRPPKALSVEDQADVLYEWFQLNGLSRTHVFANSYGCQVAAQLTAKHPEIVDRLILSGPTSDPAAPSLIQQAYRLYIDGFSEPKGAQGQLFADLSDMSIPIAFETALRMVRDNIKPKLAMISCRTLVLRGERDTVAPQQWTEEVASCVANSRFHVIPKAPHCVNYANPSELTSIILEFLREL